ncbi:hypothetical protein TorRG33x02_076940 [Trema orientale]|uniref:Uncharacterized protein n=1 Tax=Trema orientale TaxID=63057 RepID=A0A2P5FF35_TREOI|nr:hypothetical protein TorRG33x02_076940 [Trema orientale]
MSYSCIIYPVYIVFVFVSAKWVFL